jgi:putative drug exporter of the RND superfamily
MTRLAAIASGRRTKWAVIAAWILVVVLLAGPGSKLADETNDETQGFLPASAESTEVLDLEQDRFAGGETTQALIVYRRAGGLTAADRRKIAQDARRAARELPVSGPARTPFGPGAAPGQVSPDRTVAYSIVTFPEDNDKVADWGKDLRDITGDGAGGLDVYVTGDVGFNTDAEEVFGSLDAKLLIVTVLLVLTLLGAIYRSPLIALTPLVVVGVAYTVAQGLIYFYAKSGATVSTNSTTILVVLMFGVGTDYCLLLVSRYREELRRFEDKHTAMAHALCRTGPAILASGLTVALSMLVLLVAENQGIKSLGPVSAIGVTCSFVAGLTLLPALLTIGGRRAFWPRRRVVECDPEHAVHEHRGLWRQFGDRVLQRPGRALALTLLLFGVGALGLLAYKEDYSTTTFFKTKTESVDGFRVLERALPAGALSPLTVLVEREDGPVRPADVARARRLAATQSGVAEVTRALARSEDGRIGRFDVVLEDDPYKSGALGVVPDLRDKLHDLAPGVRVLVGGGTAIQYDYDQASTRDLKLIIPIALVVITLILAILLQAIVAPLVLIASVVVSFFGTFGLSLLIIRFVVGDAGIDNGLPTFAFIFLVALGIDYTIFLMSRVREEARRFGTREGMLRALGATGPVITSAGLILAGTFYVLMTLPVTFAFDLGLMVALGILLDTFVVRTIMVPAAVELLGDKVWWPSGPGGGARILEEAEAPDERPADQPAPVA